MKNYYSITGDLFIASGFVTFVLGVFFKLAGFDALLWGITPLQLIKGSFWCLVFSIALSLIEVAKKQTS